MDTPINLFDYSYTIIFVTAFFIASYVLTQKTKGIKSRKITELRLLDVPLVLTLYVVSTLNSLSLYQEGFFPLDAVLYVIVSVILLFWYFALIVYSKRLMKKDNNKD